MHGRSRTIAALCCVIAVALGAVGGNAAPRSKGFGFAPPVYVDRERSGGEPAVIASRYGTLVYAAHGGTPSLLSRNHIPLSPTGDADVVINDRNQTNIWTSSDDGATWSRSNFMGTGFATNPTMNSGFSDPDLTQDESGRIYDVGINLTNDSLFSSGDGGKTWDRGVLQCHDGDRPWVAGGKPGEVFFSTNTAETPSDPTGFSPPTVYHSTDGGQTCSQSGIVDAGPGFVGRGKLVYDHRTGNVLQSALFADKNGVSGVGISVLKPGASSFEAIKAVNTSFFVGGISTASAAIDSAGHIYLVWSTNGFRPTDKGACDGGVTQAQGPRVNAIRMAVSRDGGETWRTSTIAQPGTSVFWPWIAAGDHGRVSVVYLQSSDALDLNCQPSAISVRAAFVRAADSKKPVVTTVDPVGRPIHSGSVCMIGTLCLISGHDRRLGDYFTNVLDSKGCVLIAVADTRLTDPLSGEPFPLSRPLFIRQNSGSSLLGKGTCKV